MLLLALLQPSQLDRRRGFFGRTGVDIKYSPASPRWRLASRSTSKSNADWDRGDADDDEEDAEGDDEMSW